ncbi:MAG: transporter substrate-binding domain-containing protein [Leptolyngbyaceae cyanobacterium CSU_1_4]|nr:transporter substrate-binding domain-containing protein [Leptolyngbyaceae cyanobacterium CSU_1_4]
MIHIRFARETTPRSVNSRVIDFKEAPLRRSRLFLTLSLLALILCAACSALTLPPSLASNGTLATVLSRGRVICGVDGQRPGFSFQSPDGQYSGLDADYCRAIASALFDDPSQVEFKRVAQGVFTDLLKGKVDILLRDTPWTIERDAAIDFVSPVFYDGQGLLAPVNLDTTSLKNFKDKTICVRANTPAEATLKAFFKKAQIPINAVALDGENELFINFANGNCEIATANRSELAIRRQTLTNPEQYQLLKLTLSQEPIAPIVRSNESQWFDVVKWIIFGTFRAEELGVSKQNVMALSPHPDPQIRRFLGVEGVYGATLGLPNDFMKRVVHHVGNYAEIYQRNIGNPFQLPRGVNELWLNGGLICPMPFR